MADLVSRFEDARVLTRNGTRASSSECEFIFKRVDQPSSYAYRHRLTDEERAVLSSSSTLYVGNLSFYTSEGQIYELFSKAGPIKEIIMGLDRFTKTPCGFCFVVYEKKADARNCMKYVSGTKLDDRNIRTDLDPGFSPGRQYGRGRSGGQVRDEIREDYDSGRGGYGKRHSSEYTDAL